MSGLTAVCRLGIFKQDSLVMSGPPWLVHEQTMVKEIHANTEFTE